MTRRPRLVYLMVSVQILLVAFDLLQPFITGTFLYYTGVEFIMAYLMAVLDFILILGFMRGSRWAWFFGLVFHGINIINYGLSYLSNPIVLYALLLFIRLVVILSLRFRSVREYFDVLHITR
ncbi:MAG: hypothetical protein ACUVQ5_06390 [Candidatus Methanomethylicaceae archaeon]